MENQINAPLLRPKGPLSHLGMGLFRLIMLLSVLTSSSAAAGAAAIAAVCEGPSCAESPPATSLRWSPAQVAGFIGAVDPATSSRKLDEPSRFASPPVTAGPVGMYGTQDGTRYGVYYYAPLQHLPARVGPRGEGAREGDRNLHFIAWASADDEHFIAPAEFAHAAAAVVERGIDGRAFDRLVPLAPPVPRLAKPPSRRARATATSPSHPYAPSLPTAPSQQLPPNSSLPPSSSHTFLC